MTTEHDALHDLLAAVALGAADPTETARVEAHAARCAICREELDALRAGASVLAVDVPQHVPSPALRESLMSTVRAEAAQRAAEAEAEATPASARRAPARRPWQRWLTPGPAIAVACTALVLLVGLTVMLTHDSGSPAPDVATVAITGTSDAPGVTGRMVYVPDEDTAIVNLSHLPPLPADEAYQLWILRDGRATSAGLFEQTGPTEGRRVATGVAGADGLAVTAQPRSNQTTPEGPILVKSALPA
jgi:hypothetical protein